MNIVINGVQASSGGGTVKVSAVKSGELLRLPVQDTGPGIPPNEIGEIFDPYFTTQPEGSGLGLWIAQQIAVAHGGDLRAGKCARRWRGFFADAAAPAKGLTAWDDTVKRALTMDGHG